MELSPEKQRFNAGFIGTFMQLTVLKFLLRSVFILPFLFSIACSMGDSSVDEDFGSSTVRGARLEISQSESRSAVDVGEDYSLGQVLRFNTYTISFFISNKGNIAASNLSAAELSSGFSFKGGSFPGTGGTCGNTLDIAATCRIVISYTPSQVGDNTCDFVLNYNTGRQTSNKIAQAAKKIVAQVFSVSPEVTSISPALGSRMGGTTVTISGIHFTDNMQVSIGGSECISVTRLDNSTITCVTTAHTAAGSADIVITNDLGDSSTSPSAYRFLGPPTLTAILPTAGAIAGGTTLALTGTNFTSGMSVTVGNVNCPSVTVLSLTEATCVTGAHAAGTVDAAITGSDSQTGSLTNGYTYRAAPTVTSVGPYTFGGTAGGNSVTITGTGFLSGATVDFGGASCTSVVVNSSTSISCTTGAHAAGGVIVTVTNSDNQSGSKSPGFSYSAPVVTSVTASSGGASGGTTVTIAGGYFSPGASVSFGGSACNSVNVVSTVSITCVTTGHATGSVTVTVTNSNGASGSKTNGFTYVAVTVSSVAPSTGSYLGSTSVTLTGTGFVAGATVSFGGTDCTSVNVVSTTSITCITGTHAPGSVNVVVTHPDSVTATKTSGYNYLGVTVSTVSPGYGAAVGGTALTIVGTRFVAGAAVSVGGVACTSVSVNSSTNITCTTAARAAATVAVVVTNSDGVFGSKANAFIYQNPPTVTSLSPTNGTMDGGTPIVITGTGFTSTVSGVTVGGSACTSVVRWSATEVRCNTPAGSPGLVNVVVANNDGQTATLSNSFTFVDLFADLWTATSTTGAPSARYGHSAVWAGSKMIVFGGVDSAILSDGGIYNPVTDSWSALTTTGAPEARYYHKALWTYTKMLVWGGKGAGNIEINTGGIYDPSTNTWTAMTTSGAPTPRSYFSISGNYKKVFVWGGQDSGGTPTNTGAIYDLVANTWTATTTLSAPDPTSHSVSHWTGKSYLVWGGSANTGGLYNPVNDSWSPTTTLGAPAARTFTASVWTGGKMLVWGGGNYLNTGGIYDPSANSWSAISTLGAPQGTRLHTAVWGGGRMIVFGGVDASNALNSYGSYDPNTNTWDNSTTIAVPSIRWDHSAVWTGSKMIVWGGYNGTANVNSGATYALRLSPTGGSWSTMSTTGAPATRGNANIFWTGSKMLVWGSKSSFYLTGGLYDAVTDSWVLTSTTGATASGEDGTVAWTGSKLLVWGGDDNTNVGKIYDPLTDNWSSMTTSGAPSPRTNNFGIWGGSKLIIWGGNNYRGIPLTPGGLYDPDTDSWTTMGTGGGTYNWGGTPVWGENKLYVYSSSSGGYYYDPESNTWTNFGSYSTTAQSGIVGVWTGSKVIFWGGCIFGLTCYVQGGMYDSHTDSWTTMSTGNAPRPVENVGGPTALVAWTGSKMFVWGVNGTVGNVNAGAYYDPDANTWATLSTIGLPANSGTTNSGVWTGSKMLIWGNSTSGLIFSP